MSELENELFVWLDPVSRSGPEAMAVDEWLLETAEQPVLRVYDWAGQCGSVGYFGNLLEARRLFPGVDWVRRWTGGGTVDHRADWTYTLVVPRNEALANGKGVESYRSIHSALARAMEVGKLSDGAISTGKAACFENPVVHDLVDAAGGKLAGAGQRRTKKGLLHQGSVAGECVGAASEERALRFAKNLAVSHCMGKMEPDEAFLREMVMKRYGSPEWTERR